VLAGARGAAALAWEPYSLRRLDYHLRPDPRDRKSCALLGTRLDRRRRTLPEELYAQI